MKIHLRQRMQQKQSRVSLYLEIYKGTTRTSEGKVKGVRDYEYLDLYLVDKPRTPIDKQHNKDTLKLAEGIKAKRELEIKNGQHGFTSSFKRDTNFIEYFKKQVDTHFESKGTFDHWDTALKHLTKFAGTQVAFKEVDKSFCEGFKEYLSNEVKMKSGAKLTSNSVRSYFVKLKACLNKAVDEEIIFKSPARKIETPKKVESQREYLTFDELQKASKAECKNISLKNAFLFSCLSGLRWSDVEKLKWSEVKKHNDGWRITFHQQKTKGLQYLDLSEQARGFLGEQGKPDERVFKYLSYSSYMNVVLREWMLKAEITKAITFHSARHTHATLLLSNGADLYTVSKRLGHSRLETTAIYAKIIDEKMREAANKIPELSI